MNGIRDSGFEIRRTNESRIWNHQSLLLLAAVAVVFLAVRIALLFARQPFFDELFTVWMARQPLANVLKNLLHDSGPPLYYWMARFDSVRELRWLSLLFALAQFVLVGCCAGNGNRRDAEDAEVAQRESRENPSADPLRPRRLCGESPVGLPAAVLIAVYPPAVLFAVDGRAYALCALFVTIGVLAMAKERPFIAAGAFVLAAYSHYYGVLFFLLLLTGVIPGAGMRGFAPSGVKQRVLALIAATAAFIPGLILAFHQPAQATGWNREPLFAPLLNLSWTGAYPESLFIAAPVLLAFGATLLLIVAVSRSWHFAPAVLVPLILVLAFHLAGRPVYFPMRFECVLAGPLVLWVASSLNAMQPLPRFSLAGSLMVLGLASIFTGTMSHRTRPADPYRAAATALRAHADPQSTVVASGFCYLETAVALNRPVIAWPAEQAEHPGWRAQTAGDPRELPPGRFLWIGERQSAELARLREARRLQPLFLNERAVIARVEDLTAPLH